MGELQKLPGLGPKSERQLNAVGIHTVADLQRIGPVQAFLLLQRQKPPPSMNFLYALVGALENRHWQDIARERKTELLAQLAAASEQGTGDDPEIE